MTGNENHSSDSRTLCVCDVCVVEGKEYGNSVFLLNFSVNLNTTQEKSTNVYVETTFEEFCCKKEK